MEERRTGPERREHTRYTMDRGVEIREGDRRREGRLQDISASGAAIYTDDDEDFGDEVFAAGSQVDIDVEDLGDFGAEVIRDLEEGYAVRFDMDEAERAELVSEIMEHGIALDEL